MKNQYELILKLSIKTPFITSSGVDAGRGLDLMFSRDIKGNLIMNSSHVKGKFREAIRDLFQLGLVSNIENVFLGKENEKGDYIPERGILHFHDFYYIDNEHFNKQINKITRIKIETKTGTAKENCLMNVENCFRIGGCSDWIGSITFFTNDETEADEICKPIIMGFKWITNFGAIKGNGYGRLEKVTATLKPLNIKEALNTKDIHTEVFALKFEFIDDLFIGGIAVGTSFKESQKVIPGSVIKGSFARFLNEICGSYKITENINSENTKVKEKFPKLTKYFSQIKFSHAFPCLTIAKGRPVVIPFSTVRGSDGRYRDIALADNATLDSSGKAFEFQIDWKDSAKLNNMFGWAECQTINKTRTSIEKYTRTAHEEMLYTYQYISPYKAPISSTSIEKKVNMNQKIHWLAKIHLPEMDRIREEYNQLLNEFYTAFNSGWQFLGKRDSQFILDVSPGEIENQMPKNAKGNIIDNISIIVLQTDALLFDGFKLTSENDFDLQKVYKQYWEDVTDNSCEMINYFARQKMAGGYLIKRFNPYPCYYPYILTEAGSVFILCQKSNDALSILQNLEMKGLPIPKDIISDKNKEPWQVCPFVPENGFGEICINLALHWENNINLTERRSHEYTKS